MNAAPIKSRHAIDALTLAFKVQDGTQGMLLMNTVDPWNRSVDFIVCGACCAGDPVAVANKCLDLLSMYGIMLAYGTPSRSDERGTAQFCLLCTGNPVLVSLPTLEDPDAQH